MFRRGVSILSNYVMKQKIGCGTWGDVFIAVERASGLQRAVKRISKRWAASALRESVSSCVIEDAGSCDALILRRCRAAATPRP